MAWIEVIEPPSATGELAKIYQAIGSARGGVAAVHQVQSLNPKAMRAHLELYKQILFQRSSLSRVQRERIGVAVSRANDCDYCVGHHAEALRKLGDDEHLVAAIAEGELPEELGADRPLLAWASARTRRPADASEDDIQGLREAGFDDRAILDATLTLGYFNFVNRLVLCLGVALEEGFEETCRPELPGA